MRIFLILFLVFGGLYSQSQTIIEKSIAKDSLAEKLFAHLDKDFYLAGEITWFKIYTVNNENIPADQSSIAYAELIDNENRSVLKIKTSLMNGSGHGSLNLPADLPSGNYTFRAYTSRMKNYSAERFFEQQLTIINTFRVSETDTARSSEVDLQFLPEGGKMVRGLPSRIGFKAVDSTGKGIECKGFIISSNGDTSAFFQTHKFGMGSFYLTPMPDLNYTATVYFNNGSVQSAQLKDIANQGYVLRVDHKKGADISATIFTSSAGSQDINLTIRNAQKNIYSKSERISGNSLSFIIPENVLGEGVNVLTVSDSRNIHIAERLIFRNPDRKLELQPAIDKAIYETRTPVEIFVKLPDFKDSADLSVSVHRINNEDSQVSSDIYSYLWLKSELHGYIENPEYYFETDDPQSFEATEHLMLTHGWRKFEYSSAYSDNLENKAFSHIVTGKIKHEINGENAAGINIFLSVPGRPVRMYNTVSDSSGNFKFTLNEFIGSGEIIVQTDNRKDSGYHIEINDPFSTASVTTKPRPFKHNKELNPFLESLSLGLQIQSLYSGDKMNLINPVIRDTAPFYRKPHYTYYLDEYKRFSTMNEVIMEYILPATIRRRNGLPAIEMFNRHDQTLFRDPLFLIDGVPVFNSSAILSYDPYKLQRIDVVNTRYFHGPLTYEGILSLQTYNADLDGFTPDANALVIGYDGIQPQRIFYSPVYETADQKSSRLPDNRNVLYWEPQLTAGKEGLKLKFYTSDQPGKYRITVQGIDQKGYAGRKDLLFSVEGK